jgi:phage terminase large subunit GpA-like protein
MNDAEKFICDSFEPSSEELAWKWIAENVELPPDSELKKFDFELFPLARFVLEQLCHNQGLRRFTEMLSAQVGKTVTILAYLCHKIINRPSSVGWYTDTGINAKADYNTKILPALENCEKVAELLPIERSKKTNTLVQFGFMNLRVLGAESKSNREGKTISEVLCDEVRNYPPGAMEQIDNRFKTITNWRRILFSSAGDITQEPWLSFKKGTMHLGFWKCPHCGHKQTFRFGLNESPLYPAKRKCGGFIWAKNEKTHPSEDVYNFAELDPTIRYQCENEACKYEFKESEKLPLIRDTEFTQTNPMADPSDVSVHCWEAYMPFAGCSWASIVHKFLNASVAAKQGKDDAMQVVIKETFGEPWEEQGVKPMEGEILERCGEYSIGEEWPSEIKCAKQITVDNQRGFVKFNYSIFNRGGAKRTVETGSLATFDELRAYQVAKKIMDRGVGVDCAHKPNDVYDACLKYGRWVQDPNPKGKNHIWNGWLPLLGDDAEEFTNYVLDKDGKQLSIIAYWKAILITANEGRSGKQKPIHRFSWSNPHYKHELYFIRIKGKGSPWEIPKNVGKQYVDEVQAVERRDVRNAEGQTIGYEWKDRGRHDDSDCELMQLVMADINKIAG